MPRYKEYLDWNAFQILRSRLPKLVREEKAPVIDQKLAQLLSPATPTEDLKRNVLLAWESIEDEPDLVDELRNILNYQDASKGFADTRFAGMPGPGAPIRPGPKYCCAVEGCDKSLFQLFEGQPMLCPTHHVAMLACQAGQV